MLKLYLKIFIITLLLFFVSCKTKNNIKDTILSDNNDFNFNNFWYFKDLSKDSVPGINLDRAYNLIKSKKGVITIVAVIDTELDINNEDIKDQIWINEGEIPNNSIDDDNNGYIDDINGWNYVGTTKKDSIPYGHYEFVRIINRFDSIFRDVTSLNDVDKSQIENFKKYQKAYETYHFKLELTKKNLERYKKGKERYLKSIEITSKYIENPADKSQEKLDSLKNIVSNENHKKEILRLSNFKKYGISEKWLNNKIKLYHDYINFKFDFNYKERYLTSDDSNNLDDFPYGNNNIQGTQLISHSTKVSSIIAATRNDTLVEGINDMVKIMPLSISVSASEHDKDIALAIRYAIDNGAKIINMSIGKDFSLYPEWVYDALKYAEKHDVLVITSSGNDGYNLDKISNYPNDAIDGYEYVNNFIKVGNTSYRVDSTLVDDNSNYGRKEVDIFAPGTKITCLNRWRVTEDTGTSLSSAVVSGVASLLFSYYPNLTAREVKEIILKSGTPIDLMVLKPYPNGEKRDPNKVPFSSLSKSGKIVNAYNALLMAEEVSKKKKKKRKNKK
ncbi:subtilase family protein [Kordia periserrulae]|uniref:Subtilase family protein n=1 Tax=Kordia periserrulae TaxID=701523 RepID=A0A2T6C7E0_9FLAO|nr:S8 family serine peptidase [Kordia periserrulae]PTX64215.1 subtilase family protein [Kordia periserrulae]